MTIPSQTCGLYDAHPATACLPCQRSLTRAKRSVPTRHVRGPKEVAVASPVGLDAKCPNNHLSSGPQFVEQCRFVAIRLCMSSVVQESPIEMRLW